MKTMQSVRPDVLEVTAASAELSDAIEQVQYSAHRLEVELFQLEIVLMDLFRGKNHIHRESEIPVAGGTRLIQSSEITGAQ